MSRVSIVTDSTVCLPQELVKEYGIHVVPLLLVIEERVYRDGLDITPAEFYAVQPKARKLPTTSSPSPAAFLEAYHQASKVADSILCITLSSRLSMAYDSACSAREAARRLVPRVRLMGMLDTLYYLARGGRIGKGTFWAASILRVKPIFHVWQGEVGPLERPRTRAHALERLLAIMKAHLGGAKAHVSLMHANVPEEAERFKARVQAEIDCAELYLTDFTPAIGAHTGAGTLAVAYYGEEARLEPSGG